MAKLYPPAIAGTLPAFCGTETISVPFSMNRAVSPKEVAGFALKIKTVTGTYIATLTQTDSTKFNVDNDCVVTFTLSESIKTLVFNIGQHYKMQLAYIDQAGAVGIYSTVGVMKYISEPEVYIERLDAKRINQHNYSYVGKYSQAGTVALADGTIVKKDTTEKMYSSYFKITDGDDNVVYDSGEIIHKAGNDNVSYESFEEILVAQDLNINTSYYIKFYVTTSNGYKKSSPKYRIMQRRSIRPEIDIKLNATLDKDNGFIHLGFETPEPIVSGTFLISRATSANGYVWEEFKRFNLQSMIPEKWSLMDCTVEQGTTVRYSLQQYNDKNVYSDRIISNDVYVDFEDIFLYDGERQLKVRFNPKVSSFKTDILEQKVDTIGSQHPYILRNGNVYYKEFPLSGLISYQMDDSYLFMSEDELGLSEKSFNLTSENLAAERKFKMRVLEWLTNGKAKLFRSPTEGNFIVRLMNTSLSPNDTVGRMLHTFSSTAYEIAAYNMDNLEKYGLIDAREALSTQTRWMSVDLTTFRQINGNTYKDDELITLNTRDMYSIQFTGLVPGTVFYLYQSNATTAKPEAIAVGSTGAYMIDNYNYPYRKVQMRYRDITQGLLTYSYRSKASNVFSTIDDVYIEDVPVWQWIGRYPASLMTDRKNILKEIEDTKTEVLHITWARFKKRPMKDIFVKLSASQLALIQTNPTDVGNIPGVSAEDYKVTYADFNVYWDRECKEKIEKPYELDTYVLYNLRASRQTYEDLLREGYVVDRKDRTNIIAPELGFYFDSKTGECAPITDSIYNVWFGGTQNEFNQWNNDHDAFSLANDEEYVLHNVLDFYDTIRVSSGVITELSFSRQVAEYSFENKPPVLTYKNTYLRALSDFIKAQADATVSSKDLENFRISVQGAYNEYIRELNDAIARYKEANGIV